MLILLVNVIVVCLVVGLFLYALRELPIDAKIKNLIHVAGIVILAIWILLALTGAAPLIHIRN